MCGGSCSRSRLQITPSSNAWTPGNGKSMVENPQAGGKYHNGNARATTSTSNAKPPPSLKQYKGSVLWMCVMCWVCVCVLGCTFHRLCPETVYIYVGVQGSMFMGPQGALRCPPPVSLFFRRSLRRLTNIKLFSISFKWSPHAAHVT